MTTRHDDIPSEVLGALIAPLARLMIDNGIALGDGVELLKTALLNEALAQDPKASASQISLMTGLHRKDIRRLDGATPSTGKGSAAARVLSIWQHDPDFQQGGAPADLPRAGAAGFDALVKRAKVDAAPATLLTLLIEAGNVQVAEGIVRFVSADLVPADHGERLLAARATLRPHLDTVVGNLRGERTQLDQALRYSHLSAEAAATLEAEARDLAREMLRSLNRRAHDLQQAEEGSTLFVAGAFTHVSEQEK
ncbi:MAG: DUF6502 family protein [Pelagimonas sp.]|jgi:hypothetical protein|nr:DUF6502 family protein [Pelagimonas sp.]